MSSTNASSVASCSHRASSSSASSSSRAHVRRIDSSARAGRPSARAFELDSVRAPARSPGVPAHRRARLAIVTAMSDAVARGDGDDDGDAGPSRAALGRTRLQRAWTLSENKVSSAPREISPNSRSPSSPSWWDSPSAPSSRTRRVRRMPSYRSPSYFSPSLYPASCTAAITRAASYDGFATAIGYRRC